MCLRSVRWPPSSSKGVLRKLRVHWEASCGTALDSFTRLYFYIMVPDRETCSTLLVLHGGAQTRFCLMLDVDAPP